MLSKKSFLLLTALAALACGAPRLAAADPRDDFSFEVKEMTGDHHRAWVLDKLVTLKVGKACWTKLVDKKQRALHMATFVTRDVAELARQLTGDDWDRIESQSANTPEANRKVVEKMVDDFRARFHLTVHVEGEDCDATGNSLWLKYWTEIASALKAYPPKSGKAFVTLNATAKAKGVTADVSRDGSTFTITGSLTVEEAGWNGKIQKAFKRVSSKP